MSDLTYVSTPAPAPIEPVGGFVPTIWLDVAFFIFAAFLILVMCYYLIIFVFGKPIMVAKESSESGRSIIQHADTPRSAEFKLARVTGGGFQYKDIRDGTVAAIPDSVISVNGRKFVLTFAQLGISIPLKILAGISVLSQKGIKNSKELKNAFIVLSDDKPPYLKNETILTGYDFDNFETLLKQEKEQNLIPLAIEKVPDFVERNINAAYTEKKITIGKELLTIEKSNWAQTIQIAAIGFIILMIVLASAVIK